MASMAQKNLLQALFVPGGNRDMLDTLKASLGALTHPVEELKTLERDMQATVAMAGNLLKGIIPHDTAVPKLKQRMTDNFTLIESFTNAAMGAFNDFNPYYEETAAAAHKALKATAPTPMASLALGDITSFQKALINPLAITKIGPAMEELSNYLKDNTELTAMETIVANQLMDYVTQEHTRESITTYLADPDLQKAVAIQGLKQYTTKELKPVKFFIKLQQLTDDGTKRLYW